MKHLVRNFLFCGIVVLLGLQISCSGKQGKTEQAPELMQNAPGDSTLYGLACDGCNDSVIVLLPFDLSDPQTFDVIEAWKKHKIFGMPKIGDKMAVILSADKKQVEMVIDMDRLVGTWYRMVTPELHKPAAFTDQQFEEMKARMLTNMTDSARDSLFKPIEYGFVLNANKTVSMLGTQQLRDMEDNESSMRRVEYPKQKSYKKWDLWNGKFILTPMREGEKEDTIEFYMRRDSMVLHFEEKDLSFKRKKMENEE